MSTICSVIAVEFALTRLFLKWRELEPGLEGTLAYTPVREGSEAGSVFSVDTFNGC